MTFEYKKLLNKEVIIMGREIKRGKTKSEKLIKSTILKSKKQSEFSDDNDMRVIIAINKTREYFEMADYMNGSNYVDIIDYVYLKPNINKTKERLASDLFISESTLKRQTNNIIKCFERCLEVYNIDSQI